MGLISLLVFKFVEHPENNEKPLEQKSKVKFKIVSLKVKGQMEYAPELVSLLYYAVILFSLQSVRPTGQYFRGPKPAQVKAVLIN